MDPKALKISLFTITPLYVLDILANSWHNDKVINKLKQIDAE